MLTIVITTKNDPLLPWTIEGIWETQDVSTQIVVVDDGTSPNDYSVAAAIEGIAGKRPPGSSIKIIRNDRPLGVCPSRNVGILDAAYDAVIVADSHVRFFSPNWASQCVTHIVNNQSDVACFKCWRLAPDALSMQKSSGWEAAAWIEDKGAATPAFQPINHLFQAKWSGATKNRMTNAPAVYEVGCVLGGAYLMWRPHYVTGIGRVWGHMGAIGTAEPILSMANHAIGGRSVVLPIDCGHVFRNGDQQRQLYKFADHEVKSNYAFAAMIATVMRPKMLDQYLAHMIATLTVRLSTVEADIERKGMAGYIDRLRGRAVSDPLSHVERWREK